jgi:hypothetical protein
LASGAPRASSWARIEEAHHRHHAVDGVVKLLRRCKVARLKRVAERQEVEQQLDQRAGIAADMAAIGQDLPLYLSDQVLHRASHVPRLAGHAQRCVGQRDQRLHARHAITRLDRGVAQVADLAHQAFEEAAIELLVGVVQDQRCVAEPGDDTPRCDLRLPAG